MLALAINSSAWLLSLPGPQPSTRLNNGNFTGCQRMLLTPTVPGKTYMVEICALGGSTGQSAWSNPVSCMST